MSTKELSRRTESFPSVFDDFFKPWNEWFNNGGLWGRTLTVPAVNVKENDKQFTVSIAAPGLKKEDFKINMEGDMLTISSEKEEEKKEKEERYNRQEYSFTAFSRTFTLPEHINKEAIQAKYEDGVLNIMLPKLENAKQITAKKITVK